MRLVAVTAPRGSLIRVRCLRGTCPTRLLRVSAARRGPRRLRAFERFLRAGTVFEIYVTAPNVVGKYTRVEIRRGRTPARRDRCLAVGTRQQIACPAR